jgi:hypothetical protein
MLGMDMMLKSMIGIDPEQIRIAFESTMAHIQKTVETVDRRHEHIEAMLQRNEAVLMSIARSLAILDVKIDDIAMNVGGAFHVDANLIIEPVTEDQLRQWQQ